MKLQSFLTLLVFKMRRHDRTRRNFAVQRRCVLFDDENAELFYVLRSAHATKPLTSSFLGLGFRHAPRPGQKQTKEK